MREILNPVSPESLRPSCTRGFRQRQRGKALEALVFLDGYAFLARDGTGYFSSPTIHCASCRQQVHHNGSITYSHQMVGAAIIHPDVSDGMPLMPEPIVPMDGTATNDGERHAAKRFMAKLRQDHPHRKDMITDESLRATAPHIETLHDDGCHNSLGGKEGAHVYVFTQVQAAEAAGRVPSDERHDHAAGVIHRGRFGNDVPLKASRADVRVNCIASWEIGPNQVQHCSGVTGVRVSKHNVYTLMRGGRARWCSSNHRRNDR